MATVTYRLDLIENKLRGFTSAQAVGATGDGVTDDTAKLVAALASGLSVYLPKGYRYKITSDLTISNNWQRLFGEGVLVPVGNCGVVITGCTGAEVSLSFESSAHTGIALKVMGTSTRVIIHRLNGVDVFNALYIEQSNTVHCSFLWATCRGYGIKLKGSDTLRSDAIHFERAIVSVPAAEYGFDWDGNIHTVTGRIGVVNGKGAIIRDTSGSAIPANKPAIGRLTIESDYSLADGIRIDAGSDIDLAESYALGSAGSGLYVGAAINSREVRVTGGKYRGCTRYGIENAGGIVLYSGNSDLQSNTLGSSLGLVSTEALGLVATGGVTVPADGGYALLAGRYSAGFAAATINTSAAIPWVHQINGVELWRFGTDGSLGIGTAGATALLDVNSNTIRVRTSRTPATAAAAGNAGDICWDSGFVYVCVAANTWKRAAITTW